jgi:hypothetical protein
VLRIFIALKNPSPRPGLKPQNSGKHASHYITEATNTVAYAVPLAAVMKSAVMK